MGAKSREPCGHACIFSHLSIVATSSRRRVSGLSASFFLFLSSWRALAAAALVARRRGAARADGDARRCRAGARHVLSLCAPGAHWARAAPSHPRPLPSSFFLCMPWCPAPLRRSTERAASRAVAGLCVLSGSLSGGLSCARHLFPGSLSGGLSYARLLVWLELVLAISFPDLSPAA